MNHSSASFGTGRAIARVPRINGSGTSASGSAIGGNMCHEAVEILVVLIVLSENGIEKLLLIKNVMLLLVH